MAAVRVSPDISSEKTRRTDRDFLNFFIIYMTSQTSVKQVAELLGHTTSEITEIYYVKRDTTRLAGLTDSFNL